MALEAVLQPNLWSLIDLIRAATEGDEEQIWRLLEPVFRALRLIRYRAIFRGRTLGRIGMRPDTNCSSSRKTAKCWAPTSCKPTSAVAVRT
jgi:hypothetical protein